MMAGREPLWRTILASSLLIPMAHRHDLHEGLFGPEAIIAFCRPKRSAAKVCLLFFQFLMLAGGAFTLSKWRRRI